MVSQCSMFTIQFYMLDVGCWITPDLAAPISKWSLRPIRTNTKHTLANIIHIIIIICDMHCVMERIFFTIHIVVNLCLSLENYSKLREMFVTFIRLSLQSKQGSNVIKIPKR